MFLSRHRILNNKTKKCSILWIKKGTGYNECDTKIRNKRIAKEIVNKTDKYSKYTEKSRTSTLKLGMREN